MHFQFGKEGGAERFFVKLINALARRGVEQTIFIRPDRIWRDEIDGSIEVIERNFRNLSPDRLLLPLKVKRIAARAQRELGVKSTGFRPLIAMVFVDF